MSHWENSQMPQALRPSCSIMCRLSVSRSAAATLPPLDRPPTKATRADLRRPDQHLGELLAAAGEQGGG